MRRVTGETAAARAFPVDRDGAPTRPAGAGSRSSDRPARRWPHPVDAVDRSGPGERPVPGPPPGLHQFSGLSIGEIAERAGLKRIDVVAWRDFDDPEAGGSELHAHRVMTAWSKAGIDVSMTTSSVPDGRTVVRRDGYRVVRRSGRYAVFPRTMLSGALGRIGSGDGLVEIWNGMPFFSPLWAHCPNIVFLHHVHAEMWKMVLPAGHGRVRLRHRAPVGPSGLPPEPDRDALLLVQAGDRRTAGHAPVAGVGSPPGVEPQFSPGGARSDVPLVVAVGRLVPVKRFHLLVRALVDLKPGHPELRAVIAGEGYERPALEAQVRDAGAESWISLPGYVPEDDLIDLYRRRLGGRLHLAARGLGHDGHRGRGLWDPGGRGHPDQRPRGRGASTGSPASWSTGPTSSPVPSTRCSGRRPAQAARAGRPGPRLAIHLGRHRPRHAGRAGRRGPGPALAAVGTGARPALGSHPGVRGAAAASPPSEHDLHHTVGAEEDHAGPSQVAGRPEGERPRAVGRQVLRGLVGGRVPAGGHDAADGHQPEDDAQPGHEEDDHAGRARRPDRPEARRWHRPPLR